MPHERFPLLPDRIGRLPLDRRGIPVPWFVSWRDGTPYFPVIDREKLKTAWAEELCWVCGEKLGSYRGWVMGPMSVIEGATPEPPSHHECAAFSACHCPHLSTPAAKYNETADPMPGHAPQVNISRIRSGVVAIWITKGRGAAPFAAGSGTLFKLNPPSRIEWYARGRPANRAEVQDAIALVSPVLRDAAEAEHRRAEFERRLEWLEAELKKI